MFFLEINFLDGISSAETVFVRRPYFVIGSSEDSHVVLEGTTFPYELRIFRGLGRKFYCKVVNTSDIDVSLPVTLEQTYENQAELDLKEVNLKIIILDSDLIFKTDESADKAASRIFKTAISRSAPLYPAFVFNGVNPVVQSFSIEEPFVVGKSRRSDFRLEGDEVASEHLRISYVNSKFHIENLYGENLNSNYITKVNGEEFSDHLQIDFSDTIQIGNNLSFNIVSDEKAFNRIPQLQDVALQKMALQGVAPQNIKGLYPCILAKSDQINPKRLFLDNFAEIKIGRDPTCHIWINAPHISREHLLIQRENAFKIFLKDNSSNGTFLNEKRLLKDKRKELQNSSLTIIKLGNEHELALCYNEEQEKAYRNDDYSDFLSLENEDYLDEDRLEIEEISEFKSDEVISEPGNSEISEESEQILASKHFVTKESPDLEDIVLQDLATESDRVMLGSTLDRLSTVKKDYVIEEGLAEELLQKEINEEELLVTEDLYEQGIKSQKRFKFVTLGFIFLLIAFCLILVVGFLSDNYFY